MWPGRRRGGGGGGGGGSPVGVVLRDSRLPALRGRHLEYVRHALYVADGTVTGGRRHLRAERQVSALVTGQGGAGQGRCQGRREGHGRAGQGRATTTTKYILQLINIIDNETCEWCKCTIEQDRTGQGRAGQGRAGEGRAGRDRAGQGRAGQNRAGDRAEQSRQVPGQMTRQGMTGQVTGQMTGQGRAGQGRAGARG